MIEDIKKEVREKSYHTSTDYCEKLDLKDLFEILDKYKEKECDYKKYKTMWEELYSEKEKPCGIEYMQDLEDKYKIEVE